ncbi:MAG: hypothetical protein U0165_02630 [Polyangiaceae bacterium]
MPRILIERGADFMAHGGQEIALQLGSDQCSITGFDELLGLRSNGVLASCNGLDLSVVRASCCNSENQEHREDVEGPMMVSAGLLNNLGLDEIQPRDGANGHMAAKLNTAHMTAARSSMMYAAAGTRIASKKGEVDAVNPLRIETPK